MLRPVMVVPVSAAASAVMVVMMVRVAEVCAPEAVSPASVVEPPVSGLVPVVAAPRPVVVAFKMAAAPVALLVLMTLDRLERVAAVRGAAGRSRDDLPDFLSPAPVQLSVVLVVVAVVDAAALPGRRQ